MKLNIFSDNFKLLADAPNGVPKLREMILQLAVQGKLVPQDPKDEPASVLLEKIKAEKERLIKEGIIKKTNKIPPVDSNEMTFELPKGWEWVSIGQILTVKRGASPRPKGDPRYFSDKRTPFHWIKISDIRKYAHDGILTDTDEFLTEAGKNKSVELPKGTLVLTNSATIGVPVILGIEGGCIHDGYLAFPFFPHKYFYQKYFFVLLLTLTEYAKSKARGLAQLNLNTGIVRKFPFALPPLSEQKRIVTKVDQLMALCDELEARKNKRNESRIVLNDSALDRLFTAKTPNDFSKHWERIRNNFDLLYDNPENVDKLRQAILQLAVQGKLVPQNPKDEPASVLLEKIEAEKERLIKEKKIKKSEPLPPIRANEIPYQLPTGWEWSRLGGAVRLKSGATLNKELELSEGDLLYLKVGDMNLPGNEKEINVSSRYAHYTDKVERHIIPENSIIFPKRGGAIATNKKRIVKNPILADSNIMAMICYKSINFNYLYNWFLHIDLWELNSGTSVPQINNKDINPILFSIPPYKEQKRIVAKAQQLMALCDDLETKLSQSQSDCDELLSSIINGMAN